jgi:hypothetical protein
MDDKYHEYFLERVYKSDAYNALARSSENANKFKLENGI